MVDVQGEDRDPPTKVHYYSKRGKEKVSWFGIRETETGKQTKEPDMVHKDNHQARYLMPLAASLLCIVGLSLTVGGQPGDIRKAKLKKIDFDQQKITLLIDGKIGSLPSAKRR